MFCEIELFDKRSRTLILTDLVQNLDPDHLSALNRTAANLLGIAKPYGKAPNYLRLLLRLGGRSVRTAAERLVRLAPERVIFAHGDWFKLDGAERLRQSLRWLVPAEGSAAGASSSPGRPAASAALRRWPLLAKASA